MLSTCVLIIPFIHSGNGAQFSNVACLLFVSAVIAAASAHVPTTVIVALTSIYAYTLDFTTEFLNLI